MRILHIEDAAAVACILAKYQNLTEGCESKVLKLDKYDKFGFYKFYKDYVNITTSEELFFNSILEEAKKADIIHVHSKVELVPYLRNKFGKSKKIILHYHGTDIRGLKNQKLPHRSRISDTAIRLIYLYRWIRNVVLLKKRIHSKVQSLSDLIIVSTPDLLQYVSTRRGIKKIYLPNPVDSDLFNPSIIPSVNSDDSLRAEAVTMDTEVTNMPWVHNYLKINNINFDIDVYDRIKHPLMYTELPGFLKRYKIYVDIRYVDGKILHNLSKTGLEALACGLDVLDFDLKFRHGLPIEHCPLTAVSKLSEEYAQL
jgi:glycosyltransferase involved in cell wall biosynthesis